MTRFNKWRVRKIMAENKPFEIKTNEIRRTFNVEGDVINLVRNAHKDERQHKS